jgi:hypothetical protein
MSDNTAAPIQSPLGTPNRYTTTHDPATNKAIFSRTLPEPISGYGAAGMVVFDTYKTFTQPLTMTGETLPMHRTETIDMGVCVAGKMEVTLDSREVRVLCPGDTIVQRGTMHAWRNPSETEWARAVFFILGAKPVEVGGDVMNEFMLFGGEEGKAKE